MALRHRRCQHAFSLSASFLSNTTTSRATSNVSMLGGASACGGRMGAFNRCPPPRSTAKAATLPTGGERQLVQLAGADLAIAQLDGKNLKEGAAQLQRQWSGDGLDRILWTCLRLGREADEKNAG